MQNEKSVYKFVHVFTSLGDTNRLNAIVQNKQQSEMGNSQFPNSKFPKNVKYTVQCY